MPRRRTKPNDRIHRPARITSREELCSLCASSAIRPTLMIVGSSLEVATAAAARTEGCGVVLCCACLSPISDGAAPADVPSFHVATRQLTFRGVVAKRLRRDAKNLLPALEAFELEGWPEWIADPLPRGEVDVRDRLYNTVKRLNRHFAGMLCFECDGESSGILWGPA